MSKHYTAEIKVIRHDPGSAEKDRYGNLVEVTSPGDYRIGHITLMSVNLDDLRNRVTEVMKQVRD